MQKNILIVESAIALSKAPFPDGKYYPAREIVIVSLIDSESRKIRKKKITELTGQIEKAGTSEKKQKLTLERDRISSELWLEGFKFLSKDQSTIRLSEFCYPKNISKSIIEYLEIVFYWYVTYNSTDEDVLKALEKVKQQKVIEEMKEQLRLSYESL